MTPFYLYALVDERPRSSLGNGMARRPLSVVRAGSALVVVERAPARRATLAAVRAHDRVVRRIARLSRSVLPLRFATTAATRSDLEALVAPLSLTRAFDRVRDAVQFTLRVRGRRKAKPAVDRRAGPGTRWLAKRIAEQTVPEIANVTEATRPWVRETRSERRTEPPGWSASVYHLVAREHVRRWRAALARSLSELPPGVEVTATGPWPAYAFAELA